MKAKILITISGGIVTAVATNVSECQFVVLDFDYQSDIEPPVWISIPDEQHVHFEDGETHLLFDGTDEADIAAAEELEKLNY